MTACDVAISIKGSMSVQNSTIIANTLWESAWADDGGNEGNLNHVAAGISVGSPGNGNAAAYCKLTIDSESSVTTMGIRFYNNNGSDDQTPNLLNNGNLTVNASSFGGYKDGSYAGYGVMSSLSNKNGSGATYAVYSFVNNGQLTVNAPFHVNAIFSDDSTETATMTGAASSFTNNSNMLLNALLDVDEGSSAINKGIVEYTKNASGLDSFTTNTGTMQPYEPEIDVPSVPSDDDESLPPFIPQQPTGSDDTTLYIACCAAAAVVALLAIIIVMSERKR